LTHPLLKLHWNPDSGMVLQLIHHCSAKTDRWLNRYGWICGPLHSMCDLPHWIWYIHQDWTGSDGGVTNNSNQVIICWRSQNHVVCKQSFRLYDFQSLTVDVLWNRNVKM